MNAHADSMYNKTRPNSIIITTILYDSEIWTQKTQSKNVCDQQKENSYIIRGVKTFGKY